MTAKKLPPVHPGEILLRDFLEPLGISQYRLAKDISAARHFGVAAYGRRFPLFAEVSAAKNPLHLILSRYSVPPRRINEIVKGSRAVTANTALRLARYFDMSEQFWVNLQSHYDLEVERDRLGTSLQTEVRTFTSANWIVSARAGVTPTQAGIEAATNAEPVGGDSHELGLVPAYALRCFNYRGFCVLTR